MNQIDIDTRSDVYSLGVILYELLTGSTPIHATLESEPVLDVLQRIRSDGPPKPSSRLISVSNVQDIATRRSSEPRRLTRFVRGDLDGIVIKCLEKDRNRRYQTADALARDIERFLANEPVEASLPTAGYRMRKFVTRNRASVALAGLVAAALLAGTIGTTWGMLHAGQARREAVRANRAALVRADERRAREELQKRLA